MVKYMGAAATDHLSRVFAALADPTRRAILERLSKGEAGVQEIAKPFNMSLPAISKHLKVLERANLISRGKDAQWRPCMLEAAPLKQASEWIGDYRQFWEESFERLDEYLKEMQSKEKKGEMKHGKQD
ncbi:MAG: transcriptional regulator [Acidobacteria bacterium]|nr:MAG: transcriptional regulator [Acidobacteriota bacterium]